MKTNQPQPQPPIPMTTATKERLLAAAKQLEGQELFPEKVARAKRAFQHLKTLPL